MFHEKTIQKKLEFIDQPAKEVSGFSLAVRKNTGFIMRLFEKIGYPNHPRSQLIQIVDVLLYSVYHLRLKNTRRV